MSIAAISPISVNPIHNLSSQIINKEPVNDDVLFDVYTPYIKNNYQYENIVVCHGKAYDSDDNRKERYPNSYTLDLNPKSGAMKITDATDEESLRFIPSNSLKSVTFDACQKDMYMKPNFLTLWMDKLAIGGVLNFFKFPPLTVYLDTLYPIKEYTLLEKEERNINIKKRRELINNSNERFLFNTETLSIYLSKIGLKSTKSLYTTIIANINNDPSVLIIKLS
jgi:hypothetical protein